MLPRCVTILNTHIKTIKTWRRSIKQAMYHLLIVLVFAESYFTSYLSNESLQTFIKHLLRLVNESELIKHIKRIPINPETLLIDAALQVFSVLVYEPDALDYMKQCRPSIVFQRLAASPCKAIVSNAYLMLVYTVDENDIKESQGNLSRLLYTTLNLIHKAIYPNNGIKQDVAPSLQNISRNIIQLTETLASLVQYEQVKKEIIKQNALLFLIQSSQKLSGLSKQFILKSLWTLSFDKHIARQINHNSQFIHSLQNIKKSSSEDNQQNNPTISWNESTNDEIQKIIDGLLWNLSKESEYRANKSKTNAQTKKNDVMISYSVKDKDIVNKIEGILVNEGFTVWLDQDIIHRQNMEKVAEQIDKSTMMIVCLSDSYARDNHCFSELMYGYHSKRLIVPLIIQKQYKVDEWLRSMVDKNKCIDIDISDVKKSGPLLIKEINQRKTKYSSNVRATTPAKNVLDKQKQNTPERPTSTIRFSDRTSVIPNKEPERPSSTMRISGRTSVIPNKEPERPSSTILSSGRTSVIPYKEPERPSSTIRFSDRTSVIPNKEPERPSSTIRFSDRTTVIPYKESERPSSTPRFSGRTSAIPNKESERLSSTPKLPGRTSVLLNKQSEQQQRQQEEQKYFSESESISTQTDLTLTMASSIVGNKDYQKYLPEKYTKRNTNDSPYRSLAILTWKNDDVLDFLYDFKLHLMMPLCESMSGRALLGLYGMCQRKPHRVYRQLNSELRAHYPNLTLPMAIFNQFLSEIDTLITSPPNSTRVLPSALSNDSYYPGFMPITDQSSVLSMKSNYTQSERSMMSTGTLSSGTPMNGVPHTSRVIDRAVFRPASSANRPYDLVVESNDRASVIFQQVKRYSPQLHLLQQQAREYREMNGMH
ncbi:unnamed protein product [Adineta steineri]|uniref:TIR domain-containing protein n=1 Tax=Adineta steineri TaxID=433720 RepID=A0A814I5B3_9BILA|nr:unnamed protein product [Adineta steineri]CAF3926350.1 unnamed protein product [Adineta steineri]